MDLYDAAIAAAVKYGFVNIEALAAELASRFWFALNKFDVGQVYMDRALNAYELWGALGKADDLRSEYHGRSGGGGVSLTTKSTARHTDHVDSLDLATVLKASRAISGEIVLENLLATLIDIILENAGAESAALILEAEGEYFIEGLKTPSLKEAQIRLGQPLSEATAVSKGIVNYVIRTREHLVIANPAEHGTFRNDAYLRKFCPKSVFCAPILHKGELTGVIYLENNQVSGAFTPDRLEALNILFAQIAVSIENATLYAQQEQQTRVIEAANSTLTKEVGVRKRAEQELSSYRDHLEELVAKRTEELENAQGRLVELSRRAGMAEVASGVLHNVGNVMNSVNVGASVARDAVSHLRVEGVRSVCELLEAHTGDLGGYLNEDPAGKKIPLYLRRLGEELSGDKTSILAKVDHVLEHLEHMKKIVAAQQSYARTNGVTEACVAEEIVETALSISQVTSCDIAVVRDYTTLPPALLDRHQILQILVNLVSNARHALRDQAPQDPTLRVRIARAEAGILLEVSDNGIGIVAENLAKVFNHGFTTKPDGHGFGLHNCANAAQQMGGSLTASSDGEGKGATFVLQVPVEFPSNGALETDCA
jgi:signal transduction histidine kinase